MSYLRYIHNISGSEKTYRGVPIANGAFYQIAMANLSWYQSSDTIMADLASGDIRMSGDGSTDISTSAAANIAFLMGAGAVDQDTGAPIVSTKKLRDGFYFQCREIEWETSKLDSTHDKDLDQVDLGMTSLAFFDENRDELVSPSQATLDSSCRYTRCRFAPGSVWGIRGVMICQRDAITENLYVYGEMNMQVDPAPVWLKLMQADGGMNMYFVSAHGQVGVDEDNFTYFPATDFIDFWCYHSAGYKHRLQAKIKIALPIPGM